MGKKLIINGADFSENAIPVIEYQDAPLYQVVIVTNISSGNYGNITSSSKYIGMKIPTIIPRGKKLMLYIAQEGSIKKDLTGGCLFSTSDVSIADGTKIPNIVGNIQTITHSNGVFTIIPNVSQDVYTYITLCYSPTSNIPINNKTCHYAIVD